MKDILLGVFIGVTIGLCLLLDAKDHQKTKANIPLGCLRTTAKWYEVWDGKEWQCYRTFDYTKIKPEANHDPIKKTSAVEPDSTHPPGAITGLTLWIEGDTIPFEYVDLTTQSEPQRKQP